METNKEQQRIHNNDNHIFSDSHNRNNNYVHNKMSKDKMFYIISGTTLIILIIAMYQINLTQQTGIKMEQRFENELHTRCQQCAMYNSTGVNGLYYPNQDFYCVWAHNRTKDEQQRTEWHEYCHYLIDKEYEHFCK